jgi:hypothetical protein
MKLTWKLGMDVVSDKNMLPDGAVMDAVNIDIDRTGGINRRMGAQRVYSGVGVHDLWTSEIRGESYGVVNGWLCRVQMPWVVTQLRQLLQDAPVSFTDLNGDVLCSSRYEVLVIAPDFTVRRLGLEKPSLTGVYPVDAGGLAAGRYGVAVAYLRGDEEGPLSRAVFTYIPEGDGLSVPLPVPNESLPTKVRVYRTAANGDVLHRMADAPVGAAPVFLGVGTLGRQAQNQFTDRMISGDFVRYWRGMLWTVRGNFAFHSEPMWYGVYDPRFNFVQVPHAIRMFEPVEGGIFIGTKAGVFFLKGKTPQEFELVNLGGAAPLRGTSKRIPSSLLGDKVGDAGEYVVVWLSSVGFVIGTDDGHIIEEQRRRIVLDGTEGAVAVDNRRIVAVVSN